MAANNTPQPSQVALIPTVEAWLADVDVRFADNRFGQTTEADFRETFLGLSKVFADWRHLNTKRIKGGIYPVPYLDNLNQVPQDYRILGMQVVAVNGVDSATGGAGVTAPPVFFVLMRDSAGPVMALLDAEPTTTLTVKARYVLASGSEADRIASFEELVLEDNPYDAGDVRRYTFPSGETRLVQWKADSVGNAHPVPTGLDSDPIYRIFAPLSVAAGGASQQYVDDLIAALQAQIDALGPATGPATPATYNADVAITLGRLVARTATGVRYYDPLQLASRHTLLGIALQSASTGTPVRVQSETGSVTIPGWGLTPGAVYRAGAGGLLTTSPTGVAFQHIIGRALSADTFFYSPNPIITL